MGVGLLLLSVIVIVFTVIAITVTFTGGMTPKKLFTKAPVGVKFVILTLWGGVIYSWLLLASTL